MGTINVAVQNRMAKLDGTKLKLVAELSENGELANETVITTGKVLQIVEPIVDDNAIEGESKLLAIKARNAAVAAQDDSTKLVQKTEDRIAKIDLTRRGYMLSTCQKVADYSAGLTDDARQEFWTLTSKLVKAGREKDAKARATAVGKVRAEIRALTEKYGADAGISLADFASVK